MKGSRLSKGLTVAVILLFFSVGIQPAIAKVEPKINKDELLNMRMKHPILYNLIKSWFNLRLYQTIGLFIIMWDLLLYQEKTMNSCGMF